MAKRFTDSTKWNDPWFRNLPNDIKLVWLYLWDACDHAGIVYFELEQIRFFTKTSVTEDQIFSLLGEKISRVKQDLLFIQDFFVLQYGASNKKNDSKAYHSALTRLSEVGLVTLTEGLPQPLPQLSLESSRTPKDKDKDKVLEKDKDKDGKERDALAKYDALNDNQWLNVAVIVRDELAVHGSSKDALLSMFGHGLFKIVSTAGVDRLRNVPAGPGEIKTMAQLLRQAYEKVKH